MVQGFSQWMRWEQGQQTLDPPEKSWEIIQAFPKKAEQNTKVFIQLIKNSWGCDSAKNEEFKRQMQGWGKKQKQLKKKIKNLEE